MSEKNVEMMKKIIEAKKAKSAKQGAVERPAKTLGQGQKARKNSNGGGLFDK